MSSIFEVKGLQDWSTERKVPIAPDWDSAQALSDQNSTAGSVGHGQVENQDPSQNPVMIIVEDDPDDLFLLRRALLKARVTYPLLEARSGEEALSLLSNVNLSARSLCFILDVKLPDMTGFELLESIRETGLGQPQRFILFTGNRQPALEQRAAALGADGFFSKPCRDEEWIEIARTLGELAGAP